MSGRCIMMCAGEYYPMEIDIRPDDFVIAVDGGLFYLMETGIEPDLLLGDFDSLKDAGYEEDAGDKEDTGVEEDAGSQGSAASGENKSEETIARYRAMGPDHFLQLPVAKDDTDAMAAAKLGLEKGYREFLIYGALGGRLDHLMANVQTLVFILHNGGQAWMLDRQTCVTVIGPGEFRLPADFEGTVSLFALDSCLENVTIRGMKYEVEGATIRNDQPVGCSNETPQGRNGAEAVFTIGKGAGLLVMTKKLINRHH